MEFPKFDDIFSSHEGSSQHLVKQGGVIVL